MIKGFSTGISITQSTPPEPAAPKVVAETPAPPAPPAPAPSLSTAGKTSLKAESSFSAMAQQSFLLKQLEVKPSINQNPILNPEGNASIADGQPQTQSTMWFGSTGSNRAKLVQDAGRTASLTPGPTHLEAKRDPDLIKQLGLKDQAKAYYLLPKTLLTGDGNDEVDIRMGSDGKVHVNVNGKEKWAGSPREFQALTIDTGGGNDVVNNQVDGAKIRTGMGDDIITNNSYGSTIDTGEGANQVNSYGSRTDIYGGTGKDTIRSVGHGNRIITADGDDKVQSTGHDNYINSGSGNDDVSVQGNDNVVRTEAGRDLVEIYDQYTDGQVVDGFYERGKTIPSLRNNVDTGDDADIVYNSAGDTILNTGEGNDQVDNSGRDAKISTGEGSDWVTNTGKDSTVNTGDGDDYIKSTGGGGSLIQTGEGHDTVWVSDNKDWEAMGDPHWDGPDPVKHTVAEVRVDTGGGGDTVYNEDGSKLIMDGE